MQRTDALNYITEEFQELATDAKFSSDQTSAAYGYAIDNSLRYLGVAESDLPTADIETNIPVYMLLLEYFCLKRFARLLSIRYDVSFGKSSLDASRSQAFTNVMTLLHEGEAALALQGIYVGAAPAVQVGRMTLDYLTPGLPGLTDTAWGEM